MIVSASESDSMEILPRHFEKSLAILQETEKDMPNAFYGLGKGAHSEIYSDILRWVESQNSFAWEDILERFQLHAMSTDLEQYLSMMTTTNKIQVETSATSSRYVVNPLKQVKSKSTFLKNTLYQRLGRKV
jgi:hypothetical protein